jgi:hypothetical protein
VTSKRDATDHAKVGMKVLSRQSARVAVGNHGEVALAFGMPFDPAL